MADRIIQMWEGLRDAGVPEVMLYLPDGTASRCHWDDTTMVGSVRVALLGDQDRCIVRLMPIEACVGIGVPSPKGTDPMMYRGVVKEKLAAVAPAEIDPVIDVENPLPASTAPDFSSQTARPVLAEPVPPQITPQSTRSTQSAPLPATTAGQWPTNAKFGNATGLGSSRS